MTVQYIAPTKRRSMSKARRVRIFLSRNGICCICTRQIRQGEAWIIEHPDAVALGGSDNDEDLHPAHEKCRRVKDKDDAAKIAKRNRIIDSGYVGEGKRKMRPMPGSRASGWKRTFRYGWVRRDG